MSSVLIDTQILVWSLFKDRRLSALAEDLVDTSDRVFVSVASIYEIDFKRRDRRRLRAQDALLLRMPDDMPANLPKLGFTILPIDAELAWRAARLPIAHGDPWDRFLLCQSLILGVPLVSADQALRDKADAHPKTRGIVVF